MSLIGPRLDRPSAIGDEGRPRATSLGIASLVVLGVVFLAGLGIGQPDLVATLGTLVGGTVAGIGLLNRERFVHLLVGHFLFFVFGGLLLGWLLTALFLDPFGLAIVGLSFALLGVGLSWADVTAEEGFQNVLVGTAVTSMVLFGGLVLVVVLLSVLLVGALLLEVTTASNSPGVALAWFLLAVWYVAGACWVLFWSFPFAQLASPRRRPEVREQITQIRLGVLVTAIAVPVAIVVVLLAALLGVFDALAALVPPVAVVLSALATPWLLGALASLGTLLVGVAGAAVLFRAVTRRFEATTNRVLAAAGAGTILVVPMVVLVVILFTVPALSAVLGLVLTFSMLGVGPMIVLLLALGGLVGTVVGLFPDRAGGPAVAAIGLVVAAVWFGGGPAWLVFACVAAAVVVWDVSTYGLGLTAELGHLPETRRLELFHGVVVVGIGLVAVVLLTGLALVRGVLGVPSGTAAAFLAGIGALLLLIPLRG